MVLSVLYTCSRGGKGEESAYYCLYHYHISNEGKICPMSLSNGTAKRIESDKIYLLIEKTFADTGLLNELFKHDVIVFRKYIW